MVAMLNRLSILFDQLSLREALRVALFELFRKSINKQSSISYAQNGEDILIASLLGWPLSGFYIDVGANHPSRMSNTYLLYLRGLRGICIDANSDFEKLYRAHRPKDKFIESVVGTGGGMVEFTIFTDAALSSISAKPVAGINGARYVVHRMVRLPLRRLDDILDEAHAPMRFEVLSIDVEGADFDVLKSIDLNRYSPKLILVEAHDASPQNLSACPIVIFLKTFGYEPVAFQKGNIAFARNTTVISKLGQEAR